MSEPLWIGLPTIPTSQLATKQTGSTDAAALFRCGHDVARERLEMGYAHCSRPSCVASWRAQRVAAANLALVLMPKQGLAWVYKADAATNSKSSGR